MLEIGIKGSLKEVVTYELTAAKVGSGLVEVYATPMMIALMEKTCSTAVEPYLEDGEGTVGTLVNVSHCAATPVGMNVYCDCELIEIDRRRLVFKVTAYDERGVIGEGMHERFVINKEKFQAKVNQK